MSEQTGLIEDEDDNNETSRRKFLIGITGAFGLAFASVTGIACIQLMDQIPPDFELTVFRFIIGFIFTTIYLSAKQKLPRIEKCNIKWMIAVAICSLSYNVFIYNHFLKSITFLGIQSVQRSMNIVLSLILSKIFLRVKISFAKGLSAVLVLGGLVVILAAQYVEETSCSQKTAENRNISSVTKDMEIPMHYTTKNRTILDKSTELDDSVEEIAAMDNTTVGLNTSFSNPRVEKEACIHSISTVIATVFLSLGALAACLNSLAVSGTTLRKENTVVITFWEFLLGIAASLMILLVFEEPTFPDNMRDILLLVGHGVSASSVTYFNILAVQNIDINLYYITISLTLPLSLMLQFTVLHSVNPNANLTMSITGMIVIFALVLFLPIYEYFRIDKVKTQSESLQ